MTLTLKFAALDGKAMWPYARTIALSALAMGLILSFTSQNAYSVIPPYVIMGMLLANYPFSTDERARLDALYSALPLSRAAVVAGRYLTMVLAYLALTALGTVLALGAAAVYHTGIEARLLVTMVTAGFALTAIVLSVQLPVFFAVGYTRARAVVYMIPFVLGAGVAASLKLRPSMFDDLTGLTDWKWQPLYVAAGLVALAVSLVVARRVYASRDL